MAVQRAVLCVLFVALAAGNARATTRIVDNSGSCDDSSCTPCCTIQAAISKSSGGDVVSVAPGSYPENIDFRDMASVGNITLEASSGPGTVTVSPSSGHTVRHGDGYTNTVTIDGLDFSSAATSSCVYLDHAGGAVLRDVTANNCGYTAFVLDNTGVVTMEGCTANQSLRTGIQIDGASGATLTECTANSNASNGIAIVSATGSVQIINPTTNNNTSQGIDANMENPMTISGATVTDNDGAGIWMWSNSTIEITSSAVSGNQEEGVLLEVGSLVGSITGVTLNGLQSNGNGLGSGESGLYMENVDGPVTMTNCSFDNNAGHGVEIQESDLNDLEVTGGHADGNGDRGYSLELSGTVAMANCRANGNQLGSGIRLYRLDSQLLDEVEITSCTANDNGLADGGNGVLIKGVSGAVTVTGTTTNGNSRTGVRVDDADGEVLVSNCVSNDGLEEGIKIDAGVGPVTVEKCTADSNALEGLRIRKEDVDVQTLTVKQNNFTNNGESGIDLANLAAGGTFDATCNDIIGNNYGLYLGSAVTVDARYVWWGDPTGPSGQGPGTGDTIFAEPGGTILFSPWLAESCTGCNGVVDMTLSHDSCVSAETHKACYSITVGPDYAVYGPDGELDLTAPRVAFLDGFFVYIDGSLSVRNP